MTTRQAFEEWAKSSGPNFYYEDDGTFSRMAWRTWQAATDAALERAEKACEEEAADIRSEGKGCHTGQYDHMADGAGRCAQAIRALKDET